MKFPWNRSPPEVTLDDFVADVQQAVPGRILSITLYGSAAAGDFVPGVSRYDVLIVLAQLGMPELQALGPSIRRWHQSGQPLPLLFTPERLERSVDAFAMEFLDLQQSRRVLFGNDPIADLHIQPGDVRMHLERELRGKSLALRDKYVLAAGESQLVAELLTDSLSTFLSLFRSALRLYQPSVPATKLAALQSLATQISFDPQPFMDVEELKEGRRQDRDIDMAALFARYWNAVDVVCDAVDRRIP